MSREQQSYFRRAKVTRHYLLLDKQDNTVPLNIKPFLPNRKILPHSGQAFKLNSAPEAPENLAFKSVYAKG